VATPLDILHAEMRRQHADALATFEAGETISRTIAARIRATGQLLLLGMGASHWANRMALASYRALGVDVRAEVLSEALRLPPPAGDRVTILTSQSGASGEVRVWLERNPDLADTFGMTLEAESLLGKAVPCLIGQGGRERAFAATRSVMLTLAMHASVLAALGKDPGPLIKVWTTAPDLPPPATEQAIQALVNCETLVLSSRGEFAPMLEGAALTYMELARTPALALELGQLIHGPQEALGRHTALVLVRPNGDDAAGVTSFARDAITWGVPVVMFDLGSNPPIDNAAAIALPAIAGLAGVAQLLPAVQSLMINAAARRVEGMGVPQRSSKVTDGEAA